MTFLKLCENVMSRNIKIQNLHDLVNLFINFFIKNLSLCVSYIFSKFEG
jgi:hypothetical protein